MATASAVDYSFLRRLVMGHSQNVLDPSRDYLFDTRLTRLLRKLGMSRLEELVELLRSRGDLDLERAVAEAMTINETSFFRDARPFELLRTELLPSLIDFRRNVRTLRIWSAGCSSGQEAVSLAILLRENFPELVNWNVRIDGTDICSNVVERAQEGRYHRIEVNRGLPPIYLARYFSHDGEDWVVRDEIRSMCSFRQANLCTPRLPFTRSDDHFDMILLRNVMLYFSQETRSSVLAGMHRLMAPDGILFLGSSEQADSSMWTPVVAGGTCYYRPKPKLWP